MLISPFVILGLLLAGAAFTYLVAALWPRYTNFVPPVVSGLALILYFPVGRQLPHTASIGSWEHNTLIPIWQLIFDEMVWPLVGILLLFVFILTVFRLRTNVTSSAQIETSNFLLERAQWQPVLLICLTAAAVAVIGSATTITLIMTWTLLGLLWALFLLSAVEANSDLSSVIPRAFWILAPLLFLGIMVASQPIGSDLSDFGNWPSITVVATILAVMAQMGILPFVGWRLRSVPLLADAGVVLHLMPSLAGAGLLVRLLATGQIDSSIVLLLTLVGLFSIMQGLRRIWMYGQSSSNLPADLTLSLTSLAFLVGIWAGVPATIAAVRLFVFGSTTFFFLEHLPPSRDRWWRWIAPMFTLLAIAGLPVTAGFVALTSVYDVWLVNSRFVFVLVLVILWLLLLMALIIKIRDSVTTPSTIAGKQRDILLMEGGQILLLPGLIVIWDQSLTDIHLLSWLALLLSGVGAIMLSRYVGEVQDVVITINSAFKPGQQHFFRAWGSVNKVGRQIVSVLGESAYILEGEQGLLLLIAFLAALILVLAI